jgi:hypothetical protein
MRFAFFFLFLFLFSKSFAQIVKITNISDTYKRDVKTWMLDLGDTTTYFELKDKTHLKIMAFERDIKKSTRLVNVSAEKQPFTGGWGTNSHHNHSIVYENIPPKMRVAVYDFMPNPTPNQLIALGKTWRKGYKGNYCFFGTRTTVFQPVFGVGVKFLFEEIDDFVSLELKSENLNKIPFLDSLAFLTQKNIQNQKENLSFLEGTSEKNNIQLQMVDELKENKNIKMYLLEKVSGKKIEVFATKDFNFQKKQKNEIETKIQKILALYMIPWDNPIPSKNTNANVRVIWKQPIRLIHTSKDPNVIAFGFSSESQMLINNLTILTNNILVRQQNYGNTKFDILDTKPNDNFAGKTIELDMTLHYDKKFIGKNNLERKNNYVLTITTNNKKHEIIWKENRITNNDNTENLFELIEIIQNIIYKK